MGGVCEVASPGVNCIAPKQIPHFTTRITLLLHAPESLMDTAKPQDTDCSARCRRRTRAWLAAGMLCWGLVGASVTHAAIPESERTVLLALFANTNTDPDQGWLIISGWGDAAGTECDWFGITCDEAQEHVIKIELPANRVRGELPPLAALTQLQVFNVNGDCCVDGPSGYNLITGPLPDLSTLTELREIDVATNELTGPLPDFGQLVNLEIVKAAGNQLSGSIPALDSARNLRVFDVSENALTGNIPPLNGLSLLTRFSVAQNRITGSIPSLAGMSNLESFDASDNLLDGSIGSLDGLTSLTEFYAYRCALTGSIPSMSDLVNLQSLIVSSNHLNGSIPSLEGLSNIEVFWVDDNALSGPIPAIATLEHLRLFSAAHNALSGTIPSLAHLTQLRSFTVNDNQLTGSIPPLSGQGLDVLQQFYAGRNRLTGAIPSLAGLSALSQFEVDHNQLSGTLPELDGIGPDFYDFVASGNQLSGTIPSLPEKLMTFNVSNNRLTGSIPEFAAGSLLSSFNVRNNALTGSIPTLPDHMLIFEVGFNELTGAVPDDLSPFAVENLPGQSSLCPNRLTASESAAWDISTGIAPWYAPCTQTYADPNQFGLTGSWYEPDTSGQGMVLEIMPDLDGPGTGVLFGSWFTFSCGEHGCFGDLTPTESQRWYSFQGAIDASEPYSTLTLYESIGGNFAAPPIVGATPAGTLSIAFNDCTHAIVSYHLLDPSVADGSIPLTRLTANSTCEPADDVVPASNSLLSGAWFDPATAGQGFMFDISAAENVLFAAWYTFALDGSLDPLLGQRWYSLQADFVTGATTFDDVPIFETTGGLFDRPGAVTTTQVGTADIAFENCSEMTLSYAFASGENAGASGALHLLRLAPPPPGCSVP